MIHRGIKVLILVIGIAILLILPSSVFADTWARGNIVGLCKGTEIRTGPGKSYRVHTIVPENDWAVKLIDGPRYADGEEWWDTSRREAGDPSGGTGWVSKRQATGCKTAPTQLPPTQPSPARIVLVSDLALSRSQVKPGESVNASFRAKNIGGQTFRARYFGVKGRGPDNSDSSFHWIENFTLAPGAEFRYDTNRSFERIGTYWFTPNYSVDGSTWADVKWQDGRTSYVTIQVVLPATPTTLPPPTTLRPPPPTTPVPSARDLQVIGTLMLSNTSPQVGEFVTAIFKFRNVSNRVVNIQRLVVGARGPGARTAPNNGWDAREVDFPARTNIALQPGWEYEYRESRSFDQPGDYFAEPAYLDPALGKWEGIWPYPRVWFTVQRSEPPTTVPVPTTPAPRPTTLAPTTPAPRPTTPVPTTSVPRPTIPVPEPTTPVPLPPPTPSPGELRVIQAISLSSTTPRIGEKITATFTIQNIGGSPITIRRMVASARGPNARSAANDGWAAPNVDFDAVTNLTLQRGETYRYSATRAFSVPGEYFAEPAWLTPSGEWEGIQPYRRVWFTVESIPTITPVPPPVPQVRFPLGKDGKDPTSEGFDRWYPFGGHTNVTRESGLCLGNKPINQLVHAGEDWGGANWGYVAHTQVHAIADGTLAENALADWHPGRALLIHHEALGIWALYGHLSDSAAHPLQVRNKGDTVKQGQVIGYIYDDGANSHLHFEIRTRHPLTLSCVRGNPENTWGYGYVRDVSELRNSGYTNPSDFIRAQLGTKTTSRTVIQQTAGTVAQNEKKAAGTVEMAAGQARVDFAMRWPGSTLDLVVIDPQGRQVDEHYSGAQWLREATRVVLTVQQPLPGNWSMNVVGVQVSDAEEPYEIIVLREESQIVSGMMGWVVSALMLLLLPIVAGLVIVMATRDASPAMPGAALYRVDGSQAYLHAVLTQPVTFIGRDPRSDVILHDDHVSMHHAQIIREANRFILSDLDSKNGIFINDKQVKQHLLRDGDRIRIGGTNLLFRVKRQAPPPASLMISRAPTRDGARLIILRGAQAGTQFTIRASLVRLGRDPSADIVLADHGASRRHAEIRAEAKGYVLYDLRSTNGTHVNGQRISRHLLHEGDEIQIGKTTLVFQMNSIPNWKA